MIILDFFPVVYKLEILGRTDLRGVTVPYPGNRAGQVSNNFVDLRNTKKGFYLFSGYGYALMFRGFFSWF